MGDWGGAGAGGRSDRGHGVGCGGGGGGFASLTAPQKARDPTLEAQLVAAEGELRAEEMRHDSEVCAEQTRYEAVLQRLRTRSTGNRVEIFQKFREHALGRLVQLNTHKDGLESEVRHRHGTLTFLSTLPHLSISPPPYTQVATAAAAVAAARLASEAAQAQLAVAQDALTNVRAEAGRVDTNIEQLLKGIEDMQQEWA